MEKHSSTLSRITFAGILCLTSTVFAANRFTVEDIDDVPINTTETHEVKVVMDADQDVLGLSVYLEYDEDDVQIQSVELGADAAAETPEWFDGDYDNATGQLRYGIVFDLSGPTITKKLAAGSDLEVMKITLEASSTSTGTSNLNLRNITSVEPRKVNIITDENGDTVNPTLTDGTITFIDLGPRISSFSPSSGDPDDVFRINGSNFFDDANLTVSVCGKTAAFTRMSDTRIDVTAPDCGEGPADVEVCTDYGCDTDNGFSYNRQPGAPEIQRYVPTQPSGFSGAEFDIIGLDFGEPNLRVSVCGVPAVHALQEDGVTIRVTAPECEQEGFATVDVCTDLGCDSDPEGFFYESPPDPQIQLILEGAGKAGDEFTIVGVNFDQPGRYVEVCGVRAAHTVVGLGATTLDVIAPTCGSVGPADVTVCTDFGCDTEEGGFVYEEDAGPKFKRGDSNADGGVDLSDGVYTLNFLFLGGDDPICFDTADANDNGDIDLTDAIYTFNFLFLGGDPIPPPFAACGEDPTPEDKYGCETVPSACQ